MSGLQFTLDRLRSLIPPAPPVAGLPLARLAAYARFVAGERPMTCVDGTVTPQECQAQTMERSLALGATLKTPGEATQAVAFQATWEGGKIGDTALGGGVIGGGQMGSAGATGYNLDLWGQLFGIRRDAGEGDIAYATRILKSLVTPTTSNKSLGWILDRAFGVIGTQVTDANFSGARYNTTIRANDGSSRWRGFLVPFTSQYGGLVVTFPAGAFPVGTPTIAQVEAAIIGFKAAGTRVVAVGGG